MLTGYGSNFLRKNDPKILKLDTRLRGNDSDGSVWRAPRSLGYISNFYEIASSG